jgi:hypothetical protein
VGQIVWFVPTMVLCPLHVKDLCQGNWWDECNVQQLMEGASWLIENTYEIKEEKTRILGLQIRNMTKCKEGKQGEMWNLKPKHVNAQCCCA